MVNIQWSIVFFAALFFVRKIILVFIKKLSRITPGQFFCSFNRVYKVDRYNLISAKDVFTGVNKIFKLFAVVTFTPVVIVSFAKK